MIVNYKCPNCKFTYHGEKELEYQIDATAHDCETGASHLTREQWLEQFNLLNNY